MEIRKVNTAVIGGGASGLTAAAECSRIFGKGSTLIIEKQQKTGRKLLATGNGRCNITNSGISEEHYHGDSSLIHSVISHFPVEAMKEHMRSLGILLREESEGRIYPYSNQASTVLDAMRSECSRRGVEEFCNFYINSIKREKGKFVITSQEKTVYAENVIFATGSQASPSLGADDSGYRLIRGLGAEEVPFFPALSPIYTKQTYKNLKGVRAKGQVTLLADGTRIRTTSGEIQFTDYGLSGICVFEISRDINEFLMLGTVSGRKISDIKVSVDVMQEYSFQEICDYLDYCKEVFCEDKADMLFSGAVNKKLSQTLALCCGLSGKHCRSLTRQDIKKLAGSAKNFMFTPIRYDAYKTAQVSAGGIGSDFVDPDTLMAKRVKNLYVCGELLDVDGDCGGFNLHFAVGSALLAAGSIGFRVL